MNILIEGPDATGKTTLARYIAWRTGFAMQESEGPPRHPGDINERVARYSRMDRTIFVRHPLVSHPIYDQARQFMRKPASDIISAADKAAFYAENPIVIYCKPHLPAEHKVKDYDTPEHMAMLHEQANLIRTLYRQWAADRAHITYKIGDSMERVLGYIRAFDPVRDVEDFHRKNIIDYAGKPRVLDFELAQFRLKFMREEIGEYERHVDAALNELDKLTRPPSHRIGEFAFDNANLVHHMAESLDALADLVYVVLGTAHLHGFDFRRAWMRVHIANMQKRRAEGPAATAEERIKLKMVKPPGWEPPRHEDLVEDHAHSAERT